LHGSEFVAPGLQISQHCSLAISIFHDFSQKYALFFRTLEILFSRSFPTLLAKLLIFLAEICRQLQNRFYTNEEGITSLRSNKIFGYGTQKFVSHCRSFSGTSKYFDYIFHFFPKTKPMSMTYPGLSGFPRPREIPDFPSFSGHLDAVATLARYRFNGIKFRTPSPT